MILGIQEDVNRGAKLDRELAAKWGIAPTTLRKYAAMTPEQIDALSRPKSPPERGRMMRFRNIIYKMIRDGYDDAAIFAYLRHIGIDDPDASIFGRIAAISVNNFPERPVQSGFFHKTKRFPVNAVRVSRRQIACAVMKLREPGAMESPTQALIQRAMPQIREKYPRVARARDVFSEFSCILKSGKPEMLDAFIGAYKDDAVLQGFCTGLQHDKEAVENAITHVMNSGFVEGSNNKIKVMKREAYGRSALATLEVKCCAAFQLTKVADFDLANMIKYRTRKGPFQVS